MEYTIIGQGQHGIVITPSLSGDESRVSKLGAPSQIRSEYDNIQLLPESLKIYVSPREVLLHECSVETYKAITGKNIRGVLEMSMPLIVGTDLDKYLNTFKNVENTTNRWDIKYMKVDDAISTDEWIDLVENLVKFRRQLRDFNRRGFFHNDIAAQNIMILEDGRWIMIDFQSLTTGAPASRPYLKHSPDDIESFDNSVIKEVVQTGCFNSEIRQFCLEHGIISMKEEGGEKDLPERIMNSEVHSEMLLETSA